MMDFDVDAHLDAVERSVASQEREGKPTRAITLSRGCDTTIDDLWDAVTNRERIPRWFLPVSGDLELGGRYQLKGNAGGIITACEQLSHFEITWEFGGDVSWVNVRLTANGASLARLTLTHTTHLSEHWDQFGPGAAGIGWEMGMFGLALHLSDPTQPMPDEAAFATSQAGKAFIAGSSEGWAQAAVAAGTEPETAYPAARRTTAFYTGESVESA